MSAQVSTAHAPWRRIQDVRKVALSPVLNTSCTRVTDRPEREVVGGRDTRTRLGPERSVNIPQPLEIPQVKQANSHVWVRFAQKSELSILPRDQPLTHRRQL